MEKYAKKALQSALAGKAGRLLASALGPKRSLALRCTLEAKGLEFAELGYLERLEDWERAFQIRRDRDTVLEAVMAEREELMRIASEDGDKAAFARAHRDWDWALRAWAEPLTPFEEGGRHAA